MIARAPRDAGGIPFDLNWRAAEISRAAGSAADPGPGLPPPGSTFPLVAVFPRRIPLLAGDHQIGRGGYQTSFR
jgi:hypothetical protein